ncbi:MAG: hypothetical protein M3P93_18410, partial [Actinomycetota bacterium]|nr:hypothetical protein [Actinomycetota bacterium]
SLAGRVPWQQPLRLAVTAGTVTAAMVRDASGRDLPGTVAAPGWRSSGTLVPLATYSAALTVRDAAGQLHRLETTPGRRRRPACSPPG